MGRLLPSDTGVNRSVDWPVFAHVAYDEEPLDDWRADVALWCNHVGFRSGYARANVLDDAGFNAFGFGYAVDGRIDALQWIWHDEQSLD